MPRPKVKTRVHHIADAHEGLLAAQRSLNLVDLRTTSGELRGALRAAREHVEDGLQATQMALQSDVPAAPKR